MEQIYKASRGTGFSRGFITQVRKFHCDTDRCRSAHDAIDVPSASKWPPPSERRKFARYEHATQTLMKISITPKMQSTRANRRSKSRGYAKQSGGWSRTFPRNSSISERPWVCLAESGKRYFFSNNEIKRPTARDFNSASASNISRSLLCQILENRNGATASRRDPDSNLQDRQGSRSEFPTSRKFRCYSSFKCVTAQLVGLTSIPALHPH